jgi:hypothetical protein
MADHPPCGIYRTTQTLEGIPPGRLVYFHNHGDPGPGIYLPERWSNNRAQWQARGTTVPSAAWSASLAPLANEGLYRVREEFFCCAKRCRTYEAGLLVQLGYDGEARPLLFVPEWNDAGMTFPTEGLKFENENLARLEPLKVNQPAPAPGTPRSPLLH